MNDDIDYLKNTIVFLKEALKFYANCDNYKKRSDDNTMFSYIEMDGGVQANFALDRLKNLDNIDIDADFVKNILNNKETDYISETIKNLKTLTQKY